MLFGLLLLSLAAAKRVGGSKNEAIYANILLPGAIHRMCNLFRCTAQLQTHFRIHRFAIYCVLVSLALHEERCIFLLFRTLPRLIHSVDSIRFDKLTRLAAVVVGICLLSFGPFVLSGGFDQLRQIFRRLFPFQRGLNHAYWAPNIWALLSSLDRVLIQCKHPLLVQVVIL